MKHKTLGIGLVIVAVLLMGSNHAESSAESSTESSNGYTGSVTVNFVENSESPETPSGGGGGGGSGGGGSSGGNSVWDNDWRSGDINRMNEPGDTVTILDADVPLAERLGVLPETGTAVVCLP